MEFEHVEIFNFENALRGMRNPMNSWNKTDSKYCLPNECCVCEHNKCCGDGVDWTPYRIGKDDLKLAHKLIVAGNEHRKFLRQIFVSVDITAPLYVWKQIDTYKIGTVSNSCSTMHKIHDKEFTIEDFAHDNMSIGGKACLDTIICSLNEARRLYLNNKDAKYWNDLIKLLPESYLQKRTLSLNYENLRAMYFQRKHHKLEEWSNDFVNFINTLPYSKELITYPPHLTHTP